VFSPSGDPFLLPGSRVVFCNIFLVELCMQARDRALNPVALPYFGDVTPEEAWQTLRDDAEAVLVDVRTDAEWRFSGTVNLQAAGKTPLLLSLKNYPDFQDNPAFLATLCASITNQNAPVFFLCKTGGRSADAAARATQIGFTHACNIAGGFDGNWNEHRQRGQVTGWKAAQLPWEQA
jgi:rhodanese-related sulfurtransferase